MKTRLWLTATGALLTAHVCARAELPGLFNSAPVAVVLTKQQFHDIAVKALSEKKCPNFSGLEHVDSISWDLFDNHLSEWIERLQTDIADKSGKVVTVDSPLGGQAEELRNRIFGNNLKPRTARYLNLTSEESKPFAVAIVPGVQPFICEK